VETQEGVAAREEAVKEREARVEAREGEVEGALQLQVPTPDTRNLQFYIYSTGK
jgi:hypothetical protein